MAIFDWHPEFCLRAIPAAILISACSPIGAAEETAPSASASPAMQADQSRHPVSGLEIIDVTVVTGDERITFKTELANTPQAQTKGLMFRTELADDEAMIFPSDTPQVRSFWMRNTPISLDIIYVGPDRRILNIAENTEPYSLDPLPSDGPSIAVLEIRGGLSKELGIGPGDALEYELPEIASE